ncbi:Ig-like domain-containing protein (plasmid) [Enterobacter roggenkampii]|uniref:Ig-like domain-containing protein n=1 Tax=Enterobacter roggenkampii TaxID=1812935 RepID=UPI001C227AAD|nr:Ig-like domain-containing protein [Enterobacter roggenkampii]QWZ75479.1 Ig-like domain-containing protein [Enterobacter roggenkampii]
MTAAHNGTSQTADVQFVADATTARVAELDLMEDGAVADGTAANSVQAVVTDASGNPVSGAAVAFTATNGAVLAAATGTTGADGRVTVTLTSTRAGASTVTAAHNGTSQTADVQFVADATTARVAELDLMEDGAVADGTAANSVQAVVTDAYDNPVSGAAVAFTPPPMVQPLRPPPPPGRTAP